MEIAEYIELVLDNADDYARCAEIFIRFGEQYRKDYAARQQRARRARRKPEVSRQYAKKGYEANKDGRNARRREQNRIKAEQEWLAGKRKRKPRHIGRGTIWYWRNT